MEDKRKHPRLNISFPVECTALPSRKYFYTVTKDLSLGGVKIISNNFLGKNDPFKVTVNLIDKIINLEAKIAWCNSDRLQKRYSAGLEFKNINPNIKNELSNSLESIENT